MEWMERMNKALDYLEKNMADEISFEEAARLAACSSYHFQRMFSFITNIPLAEYVRRRRLTLAAQEIRNSPVKVIDIAIKYGYDSPDAFTRAFQKLHGVTPSAAREPGVILKAYPRISLYLTLKGDREMEYKVIEREGLKVFGKSINTTQVDGKCFKDAKDFLDACHADGLHEKIRLTAGYNSRKEPHTKQVFQVLHSFRPNGDFIYMIAAEYPKDGHVQKDFEVLEIPKGTWAVFCDRCSLNEAIGLKVGEIWRRMPEWLEATGYEFTDQPAFEIPYYTEKEKTCEVWVPIVKKQN